MSDTFCTYTGRTVSVVDPKPSDICLEDIARALSRVQRFGGHTHKPYSVAEHSVLVSYLCKPENALVGLFHDASEAYVGDVISPLKGNIPAYKGIERQWMIAIAEAMDIPGLLDFNEDVHQADAVALQTERRDVFTPSRVSLNGPPPSERFKATGYDPEQAYQLFVGRYWVLLRHLGDYISKQFDMRRAAMEYRALAPFWWWR